MHETKKSSDKDLLVKDDVCPFPLNFAARDHPEMLGAFFEVPRATPLQLYASRCELPWKCQRLLQCGSATNKSGTTAGLRQNWYRICKLKTGIQNEWVPMTLTSFIYIWQKLCCSWRWNAELNNCSDVRSKTAITKAELPCVRSYFYLLYQEALTSSTVQCQSCLTNSKATISASVVKTW